MAWLSHSARASRTFSADSTIEHYLQVRPLPENEGSKYFILKISLGFAEHTAFCKVRCLYQIDDEGDVGDEGSNCGTDCHPK